MSSSRKAQIQTLLKGIETGDPNAVNVINPNKYIQHNPQTHEGRDGLAALFQRLSKTNPHVNLVRVFSDGDYVFAHTEYDFSSRRIGFEVFRFEGEYTVEHWDNIQARLGPNPSGHSMVDGPTEVTDLEQTEANRARVSQFVEAVLIQRQMKQLETYIHPHRFVQHDPELTDGISALEEALKSRTDDNLTFQYQKLHRVLAEGNFVLTVCEGFYTGLHTSFYDLYRLEEGKLVEHWNTRETVPPQEDWKNDNGKF